MLDEITILTGKIEAIASQILMMKAVAYDDSRDDLADQLEAAQDRADEAATELRRAAEIAKQSS